MSKEFDIGAYSAYAIAVKHGYTGTEAEWVAAQEAARIAAEQAARDATGAKAAAEQAKTDTQGIKEAALREVGTAKTEAVAAVNQTKSDAVAAVEAKTDEQLERIPEVTALARDKANGRGITFAVEDGILTVTYDDGE